MSENFLKGIAPMCRQSDHGVWVASHRRFITRPGSGTQPRVFGIRVVSQPSISVGITE